MAGDAQAGEPARDSEASKITIRATKFPFLGCHGQKTSGNHFERQELKMPSAVTEAYRKDGLATLSLLRTVWALVLSCYTGENDVCFGWIDCSELNNGFENALTNGMTPGLILKCKRWSPDTPAIEVEEGEYQSEFTVPADPLLEADRKLPESSEGLPCDTAIIVISRSDAETHDRCVQRHSESRLTRSLVSTKRLLIPKLINILVIAFAASVIHLDFC